MLPGLLWIPLVFAAISAVFAGAALRSWSAHRGKLAPRERTWAWVAAIFALVAVGLLIAP